jgi:hypothetical protein
LLGVKPDAVTFTVEYFWATRDYVLQLTADGLVGMDDTLQEQTKQEWAEGKYPSGGKNAFSVLPTTLHSREFFWFSFSLS